MSPNSVSISPKVVIIESPSPADLFDGRVEGRILEESLKLFKVPVRLRLVLDIDSLDRCFREDVATLIQEDGCVPIIHFSGHGGKDGFRLGDGTVVEWSVLSEILAAINEEVARKLIVCLSCCEGLSAMPHALFADPLPFASLVAHTSNPTWAETAVAFTAFYHLLRKGLRIKDAVEGMKAASGNPGFKVIQGTDILSLQEKIAKIGGIDKVLGALQRLRE